MKYVALFNLQPVEGELPHQWAAQRESEGFYGIAAADHFHQRGRGLYHGLSSLAAMATTTTRVQLSTAFANNLIRSPVEFAQAALSLQQLSNGRFEAGLGSGWQEDEIEGAGLPFHEPAVRARMFREAIEIVRSLFSGPCEFHGEFYDINLPAAGPACATPPRIAAAIGGAWTMRNIGPLVDHIELFPGGAAVRGVTDFTKLTAYTADELLRTVDTARQVNPAATVGLSLFAAIGDNPTVNFMADAFRTSALDGLAGPPDQVAEALNRIGQRANVDRITIVPPLPGTPDALAGLLHHT